MVVIGSGFGGSVTAYRCAKAGHSVCVLERGRAYPPNSFARSPFAFARAFWDPSRGRCGLFNIWSFDHMDAIVSAGLGGGSLIYANVLIRKDERWFAADPAAGTPAWPVTRDELDPHYKHVETMLNAQVFPASEPGYTTVRKTAELKAAAEALGFEPTTHDRVDPTRRQWYLPLLAVTFHNQDRPPVPGERIQEDVPNLHNKERQTCRLCGECDIGCNYGAKNTLDYNYLTRAQDAGAQLRTLAHVTGFARAGDPNDGFTVSYKQYSLDDRDEIIATEMHKVHARHLVLSAGTIGSTRLLLRYQSEGNEIGRLLGHRFSGNGDFLTLALNARQGDHARTPRLIDPSHGPVITSTLRSPDGLDVGGDNRGYYLQDAGYPVALDWLVQLPTDARHLFGFALHRLWAHWFHRGSADIDSELQRLLGDTTFSAGSLPLLGMGRDVPGGRFRIEGNREGDDDSDLHLDWDKRDSTPFFDELLDVSKQVSDHLHARFLEDPLTSLLHRLITVHPLGGCSMGATEDTGVVSQHGNVFGQPGLHVADGSVLPGPVGPNPSLTIAAVADHFADHLIEELAAPAAR